MHLALQAGAGERNAHVPDDLRVEDGVDRLAREVALEECDRHLDRLRGPAGLLLAVRRVAAVTAEQDDRLVADVVEVVLPVGLAVRPDAGQQAVVGRHAQASGLTAAPPACLRGLLAPSVLLGAEVLARAAAVTTAVLGHSG